MMPFKAMRLRNPEIAGPPAMVADPHWANVSLLIKPGNAGAQADGSAVFTDLSTYGHTVTTVGNAQVDTGILINGSETMLTDGSGDGLSIANHAAFGFGTGDFTWELWIRRLSNVGSDQQLMDSRVSGAQLALWYLTSAGFMSLFNGGGGAGAPALVTAGATPVFLAISRASGVMKHFVGNTEVFSVASTHDYTAARPMRIAQNFAGTGAIAGNWNMMRVTKGVARYTAGGFALPYNMANF